MPVTKDESYRAQRSAQGQPLPGAKAERRHSCRARRLAPEPVPSPR